MKAVFEKVIVKFDPDESGNEIIVATVLSVGDVVPTIIEEGMEVLIGKFAGQIIDDKIILNYNQILAINE